LYIRIPCDQVAHELRQMNVHPAGVTIMAGKAVLEPVLIRHVRTPAANIIKQEMLALGAECANETGTINCSQPYTDILLIGSRKQYGHLLTKLASMAKWFGIGEVMKDLERFLDPGPLVTRLTDGRQLTYEKMRVMGILNVTPDSFYASSRVGQEKALLAKAESMLEEGADLLDIGGESTRPGADPVAPEEEIHRVSTAITALRRTFPEAVLSVDTYHAETARAALDCGADIINDVTAGTGDARMIPLAASRQAPIILMHMRGTPKTMVQAEQKVYDHVVRDVTTYLLERAQVCMEAGLGRDQLILDPGLGFAKDGNGNLALCKGLASLTGHGMPVLLAGSRKGFIGNVLGNLPAEERLEGTMALSACAVYAGAQMVRVHDVKQNVRIIRMLEAILACQ
jgi:dihydropteroate synthase